MTFSRLNGTIIPCFLLLLFLLPGKLFSENMIDSNSLFQATYHLRMGDKFYDSREIPGNLEKSQQHYLQVLAIQPKNQQVLWRLCRSFRTEGEHTVNKKEKLQHYQTAMAYGEKAVKLDSTNYRSHLWVGIAMGSYALAKGVMESLNLKSRIKMELTTVLAMKPKNIRARLALAHWYFYLPKWIDGDKTKALALTDAAIHLDVNYTRSYLLKAKLLKEWGKKNEAYQTLTTLLRIKDPSEIAAAVEDKAEATQIIASLKLSE